ncbi:MAG: Spy/CpxP family protein refolding chaperone [Acidobacteriota bacterium]
MKRRLAILTLTILAALPVMAQPGPRGGGGNRLDYLAGYLSLTDAQKTQAKAIFDAAATATETARGTLDGAHTALQTAVKANASDAELDRLSAAIGTIQGQITAIQAKAQAKFYALLTAEQKTKYDARPMGGMGGPRGPRHD